VWLLTGRLRSTHFSSRPLSIDTGGFAARSTPTPDESIGSGIALPLHEDTEDLLPK